MNDHYQNKHEIKLNKYLFHVSHFNICKYVRLGAISPTYILFTFVKIGLVHDFRSITFIRSLLKKNVNFRNKKFLNNGNNDYYY